LRLMDTVSDIDEDILAATRLRLRSVLSAWFGERVETSNWTLDEWRDVLKLAKKSKTIGFLLEGSQKAGLSIPAEILEQLQSLQSRITQRNQINFAWTLRATSALETAGISVLAFKGPLRTRDVYQDWGARASSDIDLLINRSDYEAGLVALQKSGFKTLVSDQSRWWRDYLGEIPLGHADASAPIVDLHHQVQQPGGPYPKDMDAFFQTSQRQVQGQQSYLALDQNAARLVTAICYGKAVRDDSPWGHHAHELLVEHYEMSDQERESFLNVAEQQGLSRLYQEAFLHARRLYRLDTSLIEGSPEDQDLMKSAMGMQTRRPLFRTRRLWSWLDGGVASRSAKMASELWHVLRSEMVRLKEQRSGRLDAL